MIKKIDLEALRRSNESAWKADPRDPALIRKEQEAARKEQAMRGFFSRMTGRDRRALRRAQEKISGKKESITDMMRRMAENSRTTPARHP